MKIRNLLLLLVVSSMAQGQSLFANTFPEQKILIAVHAHSGKQHAFKKWHPTIHYLNTALPRYYFAMYPYTSLQQQLADAEQQKFHFVLTNPATYVEMEVKHGARALLTLINNRKGSAQTRFGSVIFTHVDHTDILELRDLRNRDFMGVVPIGFGGWRVALKELHDQGIDPQNDFASLGFGGSQPRVVKAVRDKKVHAGVVRTDMLERLADRGKINLAEFRILHQQETPDFPFFHSSTLYPEWPFAVMPHTSEELAQQVRQALLKIQMTDPAAKAGMYMGWTPALSYEPVKELLKTLQLSPYGQTANRTIINSWTIAGIVLLIIAASYLYIYRRKQT